MQLLSPIKQSILSIALIISVSFLLLWLLGSLTFHNGQQVINQFSCLPKEIANLVFSILHLR